MMCNSGEVRGSESDTQPPANQPPSPNKLRILKHDREQALPKAFASCDGLLDPGTRTRSLVGWATYSTQDKVHGLEKARLDGYVMPYC